MGALFGCGLGLAGSHAGQLWRQVLAGLDGEDAVRDSRRQFVRPLVHRLVRNPYRSGGGSDSAAQQFDGLCFTHARIEPQFKTMINLSSTCACESATMVANDTLGGRLEEAMRARSESVTSLAGKSGLTYQGVRKIVRGETKNINASTCAKLAACLGVSAEWLGTGAGSMEAAPRPADSGTQPLDSAGRGELSPADWGLLRDIKLVLTESELADIRGRAERTRRIAAEQLKDASSARPAAGNARSLLERIPQRLGPQLQGEFDAADHLRKQEKH
jgi:transcriptional regulator with XRE-family HTH domain